MEASLNEGALTLVNGGQPCLRIIFDVTAELKKKKDDWRLEMGLGALQASSEISRSRCRCRSLRKVVPYDVFRDHGIHGCWGDDVRCTCVIFCRLSTGNGLSTRVRLGSAVFFACARVLCFSCIRPMSKDCTRCALLPFGRFWKKTGDLSCWTWPIAKKFCISS